MTEYIYTEQDMQIIKNVLARFREEHKHALQLLWAAAMQSGGTLMIDESLLVDATDTGNDLVTWSDPKSVSFCIRASRPTNTVRSSKES